MLPLSGQLERGQVWARMVIGEDYGVNLSLDQQRGHDCCSCDTSSIDHRLVRNWSCQLCSYVVIQKRGVAGGGEGGFKIGGGCGHIFLYAL